ncbi:hypothetical protein F5148DRAFT_1282498 [Russula earlei]|uniref:Uncharacterized protein n=1 Tax=Russula earlei TaxID=71964 RepID=A0ACC0UE45_9AGAM|nr:hypothetical protein F5148DRAFT_1282498 [Russula earlei]
MTTKPRISDMIQSEKNRPAHSVDDLRDKLGCISLASSPSTQTAAQYSVTRTHHPHCSHGHSSTQVRQDALFELTARSAHYWTRTSSTRSRCSRRRPRCGLHPGVHERGTFTEWQEWRVDGASAAADTDAGAPAYLSAQLSMKAAQIVRLASVLRDVQELAISRGHDGVRVRARVRKRWRPESMT